MRFLLTPLVAAAVLLAACAEQPTRPQEIPQFRPAPQFGEASVRRFRTLADAWRDLAARAPGFQSVYYASTGRLTVNVALDSFNTSSRSLVVDWLRQYAGITVAAHEPETRKVRWAYDALDRDYQRLIRSLAGNDWLTSGRIDDRRGIIVITVDDLARADDVHEAAAVLAIPDEMVAVEQLPHAVREANLRQTVRPVHGGLQIYTTQGIGPCTLGLNGYKTNGSGWPDPAQPVFMTAAHCTNVEGQVTGTVWGQATASSPIGVEIHQAPRVYPPECPWTYCVYADVAVGRYNSGVNYGYGKVYETDIESINITGTISIVGNTYGAITGQTVYKVGRTTGTTSGTVTNSCVDLPQYGPSAAVFCMQTANYFSSGGDSGAPVWVPYNASQPSTTPAIAGIHVAAIGMTRYFSPINNIWYAQNYQFYW